MNVVWTHHFSSWLASSVTCLCFNPNRQRIHLQTQEHGIIGMVGRSDLKFGQTWIWTINIWTLRGAGQTWFCWSFMVCCSCEMNLNECSGTTRSSWSAVSSSTAGYWTSGGGTVMLCSGEYLVLGEIVYVPGITNFKVIIVIIITLVMRRKG